MAYETTNPPVKIGQTIGGNSLWMYVDGDDDATIIAAAYVTNAAALGMQVNDVVLIVDTASPKLTPAMVTAVASTGSTMIMANGMT